IFKFESTRVVRESRWRRFFSPASVTRDPSKPNSRGNGTEGTFFRSSLVVVFGKVKKWRTSFFVVPSCTQGVYCPFTLVNAALAFFRSSARFLFSWPRPTGSDANHIPRTKPILSIREPFIVGYSFI